MFGLDDEDGSASEWDAKISHSANVTREILVALQPLAGFGDIWDRLTAEIEAAPASWRWWIRRHPASRPDQDPPSPTPM